MERNLNKGAGASGWNSSGESSLEMNWKNDGIWLLLLIPIIGLLFALGTNMSRDIVSLLLLVTIVVLFIIRRKMKHTHRE
jgi:hypothetical protein